MYTYIKQNYFSKGSYGSQQLKKVERLAGSPIRERIAT